MRKEWPPTTLIIEENNATAGQVDPVAMLKLFKKKADHHCALMNDAHRVNQLCMFRAHSRIASGYYQAVRILEKELKIR